MVVEGDVAADGATPDAAACKDRRDPEADDKEEADDGFDLYGDLGDDEDGDGKAKTKRSSAGAEELFLPDDSRFKPAAKSSAPALTSQSPKGAAASATDGAATVTR